ncbi:MAG: PilZ domain-containing protein [Candidatus Omnitrophota bacterium]|nr:PilZ domain-containing protein [Candidatus Omnitrophota bacterium]
MIVVDKRLFERFKVSFMVGFSDCATQVSGKAVSYDISAGGIRLNSVSQNIKPLERLMLRLGVPDGKEVILKAARVVWTRLETLHTLEMGLEFDELNLFNLWRVFDRNAGFLSEE